MSTFWSIFIIVVVFLSLAGCYWLIQWTSKPDQTDAKEHEMTGHVWDEDLREYNHPLPRWWLGLFYITILFAVGYLVFYPGLGNIGGLLSWSSVQAYEDEILAADKKYGEVFRRYANHPVELLANDTQALQVGRRLFLNHCAACHGSDAKGGVGFPNLTDADWLYGGDPDAIKASITNGRFGIMPALGAAMDAQSLEAVVDYVAHLHARSDGADQNPLGHTTFQTFCSACHGPEGKGNPLLGAPNLSDTTWLYGGTIDKIRDTIVQGRNGQMPAHKSLLSQEKIHVLTTYVYSMSLQNE